MPQPDKSAHFPFASPLSRAGRTREFVQILPDLKLGAAAGGPETVVTRATRRLRARDRIGLATRRRPTRIVAIRLGLR